MKKRLLQFTACLLILAAMTGVVGSSVKAESKRIGTVTSSVGLWVRDAAGIDGTNRLGLLPYGATVTILDQTTVGETVWFQINGNTDVGNVTGWSSSDYITVREIIVDGTYEQYLASQGFPESYWEPLINLHALYPNWQFEAVLTGLNWNDAVAAESRPGVKLAYRNSPSHYIDWNDPYVDTGRDGYMWVQASKNIIAYYMDPRNFLSDPYLFMFESQSYNPATQTVEGVEDIIGHSFMKAANTFEVEGKTYTHAQAILEAAAASGVSAYHLASRMLQEQGTNGSRLSLGTVPGYEGYYNYFNIGAYPHSGNDSELNGAQYAKMAGWDNPLEAIMDGARFLGNSYINAGQDTVYFQNFNVVSANAPYTHQYMTNVQAGETESQILRAAYTEASVQNAIVFRIPVYENMPDQACPPYAGKWVQNEVGWWYDYGNGTWPAAKWEYIDNNWYFFNEGGYRVSGWHYLGNAWYYMNESGIMETGWLRDGATVYYLSESGAMLTGWQQIDGKRYFFLDSGAMQIGWLDFEGDRYYLDSSGAAVTGWQTIDTARYYFNSDNTLHVGWLIDGDARYWLGADGKMAVGWREIDGTRYYLDENGRMVTGWLLLADTWYYLDASGAMRTGWLLQGNTWYYLHKDGKMAVGWLLLDGTWYYCNGGGEMVTGWLQLGNIWYYLDPSGAMRTGWLLLGNTWYYLDSSGAMHVGWLLLDGTWYYCNGGGEMVTGWLLQGNTWYYLEPSGAMRTGWLLLGDTWYWFDQSGAMATGTRVIDGITRRFADSGAWIA